MASKYGSLQFPFQEDLYNQSLGRTKSVNDTISSAIRIFCLTSPGQRRGNIVGSLIPSLKHKLIPEEARGGIAKEIQGELQKEFPGVIFNNIELSQDFEDNVINLHIKIDFSTPVSDLAELTIEF